MTAPNRLEDVRLWHQAVRARGRAAVESWMAAPDPLDRRKRCPQCRHAVGELLEFRPGQLEL